MKMALTAGYTNRYCKMRLWKCVHYAIIASVMISAVGLGNTDRENVEMEESMNALLGAFEEYLQVEGENVFKHTGCIT